MFSDTRKVGFLSGARRLMSRILLCKVGEVSIFLFG